MDSIGARLNGESQPPILCWGLDKIFGIEEIDMTELTFLYPQLKSFLGGFLENRSYTGTGLLGWMKVESSTICRSGESGWDNSTRFDHSGPDDNIDLSSFIVNELSILKKMAKRLGEIDDYNFFESHQLIN